MMNALTKYQISESLEKMGLRAGDTVMIHASIKAMGYVEGGPCAVVRAILDVLGSEGTLVAPAFNFAHEIEDNPLIDPYREPSEMGSITEEVRCLPSAARSIAYRHSVSAYGPNADWICGSPGDVSPFSREGSFGRMLQLNAYVLLIGVAYTHCTCGHFAEFLYKVPYRQVLLKPMRVVQADGTVKQITGVDYQPKPNADGGYYHRPADFNKAGAMLEELGKVHILPVGNAYFRLFKMRDFIDLVGEHLSRGRNILYFDEGQTESTPLRDGLLIEDFFFDKANRQDHSVRSVVSVDGIYTCKTDTGTAKKKLL